MQPKALNTLHDFWLSQMKDWHRETIVANQKLLRLLHDDSLSSGTAKNCTSFPSRTLITRKSCSVFRAYGARIYCERLNSYPFFQHYPQLNYYPHYIILMPDFN